MFRDIDTMSDYYNNIFEKIKVKVLTEKDEFIIGTTTKELAVYYFSNNHLQKIEIDNDCDETLEYKKDISTIPSYEREEGWRGDGNLDYEYKSILVSIPIILNNDLNIINELVTLPRIIGIPPSHVELKKMSQGRFY